MGSNCFYLYFIPRREPAKAEPEGVHLNILCFIQLVRRRVIEMPISANETKMPKCFIAWVDGWVGGWVGGGVDGWTGCDF